MPGTNDALSVLFWSATTIALYLAARHVHRRWPWWWTSPLVTTPALLGVIAGTLHTSYSEYIRSTHWLMVLMGPATVAFAVPIYEQRAVIRRYWPVLIVCVLAGSAVAMATAWFLASLLGLTGSLRLSLLPRSISTPFAMSVSGDIGGTPDLTAVFVVITAVFGTAIGELLLSLLPLKTGAARGALFGMGAHGAGVAKAGTIGQEEASVASLVMVMAGLVNVLAAPLVAWLLK